MRSPALADQLAYYLLRVCGDARHALTQLDVSEFDEQRRSADGDVIRVDRE